MRFQLLPRYFACAMMLLAAGVQATKIQFNECKMESKDPNVIKVHKPCEPNGDALSFKFEILKEILDDETMHIETTLNGELMHDSTETIARAFESKKPYMDYNDDCNFNLVSPISTGMRGTENCKVDGSSFQGMENKEFEISGIVNDIMAVTLKGKILED